MKKFTPYILMFTILVGLFTPSSTHAGAGDIFSFLAGWSLVPMLSAVFYVILQLVSLVLWFSGVLLNFVMNETVVNMASNIKEMTGINIAWKVIRDLMNIVFIFLLVYEGILMIIGQSDTNKLKKFVTGIVLASLLINFSLFFTKVIIDASNVVTIGIYNSILVDTKSTDTASGLSNAYQQALGTQGFLKGPEVIQNENQDITGGQVDDNYNYMTITIMASLLFLITSFVFFAISVMFVVRYIVLIILLVLSPVAYMGMALLPGIKRHSDEWWETLWSQILFAPVFMLMTWVILILITSPGFTGAQLNPAEWVNFTKGNASSSESIALFFNFALIIGLTITSLITAKSVAAKGSALVGKFTSGATAFAGGAIMGGAGWAQRRTIGAAASRLSESQRFQNFAARNWIGEQALKGTRGVASSNFDVRSSKIGEKLSKTTGIDFGQAQKGGFNSMLKEKTDKQEEFAKSLRGDVAKEQYATRKASGLFTRGGSTGSGYTLFGTLGRQNRIVASRILNKQLEPLESSQQSLQNRESQISQQLVAAQNELNSLQNNNNRSPQQNDRLNRLNGGINDVGSIQYMQDQLNTTQTNLTNTTAESNRIRGVINTTGIVNTEGVVRPGQATPGQTARLAQLNNQLVVVRRALGANPVIPGTPPTPTQAAWIAREQNINAQITGLQNAINTTIANTTIPANPALGVRNVQRGTVRGRRADEQNY